jgi:septum site-determining protein MinC
VTQTCSRHIRFRGRSFPVLALEPEAPLSEWVARLDAYLAHSPAFFAKKPIVVDVAALGLERSGLVGLVKSLTDRGIRVMGVSGVESAWSGDDLPPVLTGSRPVKINDAVAETRDVPSSKKLTAEEEAAFQEIASTLGGDERRHGAQTEQSSPALPEPTMVTPLVVNAPVRSGQTIYYPEGDVTVIGSVSSGADIIAGGSIHIYGTLRGRAMAGAYGEARSRIFCRRLEAELIAVGGVYLTADEIGANVHKQPIQAWLENECVRIALLD